jgi:ATP-dependent helicase/nuclease subunit A
LQALRPRTAELSASEILSVVIDELDLRRVVIALGHAEQRLDNLDRLRRYALDYESACTRLHSAATLGGFLLWLNDLSRNKLDAQGSGESEDAVKVLTYHRSKGLEYPVTICHNLDQTLKEQIWGLNLVPETATPDLDNILGNRWLRFWVNPYADLLSNTRIDEAVRQSEAFAIATRAALEEEARLLYVGLTRARDYLVFPTTPKPTRWLNRVFNNGQEDIPTLDPDSDETPFYHAGLPLYADTEVMYKEKDFGEALPDLQPASFHSPRIGRRQIPRAPLMMDVSGELPPNFDKMSLGEPQLFAPWLEYTGDYKPDLSKAVQAVLCTAIRPFSLDDLTEISNKQLITRQLTENLRAEALARHAEQFFSFWQKKMAPQNICAQYPLELQQGKRMAQWSLDLWLEKEDTVVALQFGGFTEGMKKWKDQARNLGPFMGWTHLALRAAFPDKKTMLFVVFGLEGQMVEVVF